MHSKKESGPQTVDFVRRINDLLALNLSEDRFEFILGNVKANWKFFEGMETASLDKQDDPGIFLYLLARFGGEHGQR